jgi:hypothetical protein
VIKQSKSYKIEDLTNAFDRCSDLYKDTIDCLQKPDIGNDIEGFCNYLFLIRFKYNFAAISSLLKLYLNDSYFKIPIFLILRTCLSDVLTLYYFLLETKNDSDNKKSKSIILGYLADSLHREINNLKNKKGITGNDYDEALNSLKQLFPIFFTDSNNLIKNENLSFYKIYEKLKDDDKLSWISNAFEYYNYLSKFEHVSILTNEMQEFHTKHNDFDKNGILVAFALIFDANKFLVLQSRNEILIKEMETISELIRRI